MGSRNNPWQEVSVHSEFQADASHYSLSRENLLWFLNPTRGGAAKPLARRSGLCAAQGDGNAWGGGWRERG